MFAAVVAGDVVILELVVARVDQGTGFFQELGPPTANPFDVGFVVGAQRDMWLVLVLTDVAAVDVAVQTVAFTAVVAGRVVKLVEAGVSLMAVGTPDIGKSDDHVGDRELGGLDDGRVIGGTSDEAATGGVLFLLL